MSRDFRVYLDDILESIAKIERYISGMELGDFEKDDKTVDACVKNLEIVGEASKNIPWEIQVRYPDIAWKKIGGLRDILVHAYFGMDIEIIWDILKNKLPELKQQTEKILAEHDKQAP